MGGLWFIPPPPPLPPPPSQGWPKPPESSICKFKWSSVIQRVFVPNTHSYSHTVFPLSLSLSQYRVQARIVIETNLSVHGVHEAHSVDIWWQALEEALWGRRQSAGGQVAQFYFWFCHYLVGWLWVGPWIFWTPPSLPEGPGIEQDVVLGFCCSGILQLQVFYKNYTFPHIFKEKVTKHWLFI